ncbi:MAG: Hin recombinase [Telluria sp.]
MGRKSSLTEKQWGEIGERLVNGEQGRVLAREFGISEAAIRKRFGAQTKKIKSVANQLVAAESAFKSLPIGAQISARTLADRLLSISDHLAGAAEYGAATAHRLSGIANAQVARIDDADPLKAESLESLKGISALTKLANESSTIAINLINANKETIKDINKPEAVDPASMLRELAGFLPD